MKKCGILESERIRGFSSICKPSSPTNPFIKLLLKTINPTKVIIVIAFGIITVLTYKPVKKEEIVTKNDYYLIFFLGVLGAILIYMKIKDLGYLAYLISIIAGILIVLLSKLVIEENGEE